MPCQAMGVKKGLAVVVGSRLSDVWVEKTSWSEERLIASLTATPRSDVRSGAEGSPFSGYRLPTPFDQRQEL